MEATKFEVTLMDVSSMGGSEYPVEYRVGYYDTYSEAVNALVYVDMDKESLGYLKRCYGNGVKRTILVRYE